MRSSGYACRCANTAEAHMMIAAESSLIAVVAACVFCEAAVVAAEESIHQR